MVSTTELNFALYFILIKQNLRVIGIASGYHIGQHGSFSHQKYMHT